MEKAPEMAKIFAFKCSLCLEVFLEEEQFIDQHILSHHKGSQNESQTLESDQGSGIESKENEDEDGEQPENNVPVKPSGNDDANSSFKVWNKKSQDQVIKENLEMRKPKPHKCDLCGIFFRRTGHLNKHMKVHVETHRPWKCSQCHSFYSKESCLRRHENVLHDRKVGRSRFTSKICERACLSPSNLAKHQLLHDEVKPFKCPICPKTFRRKFTVRKHVQRIHKMTYISALKSVKRFAFEQAKQSVSSFATVSNPNEVTGKRSPYFDKLTRQAGLKPHKCAICTAYSFRDFRDLKKHMKIHEEIHRPWKCSKCPSFYLNVRSLRKHEKLLHNKSASLATNPRIISRKAGSTPSKLTEQRSIQSNGAKLQTFQCPICKKTFQRMYSVRKHVHAVHDEKTHVATSFKLLQNPSAGSKNTPLLLGTDSVKKIPTTRKIFRAKCSTCHRYFRDKCDLSRHMKIHQEAHRPWKCVSCPSFFFRKASLKFHENRVHGTNGTNGSMESPSNISGNVVQFETLPNHFDSTSGSGPCTCPLCGGIFKTKSHFMFHLKTWHRVEMPLSTPEPSRDCPPGPQKKNTLGSPNISVDKNEQRLRKCTVRIMRCDHLFPSYKKNESTGGGNDDRNGETNKGSLKAQQHTDQTSLLKARQIDGVTKFECAACSKLFKHRSAAIPHLVVHTLDKPYQCPVCPKTFAWRKSLSRHSQVHTIGKSFP